jgi:hypothetical protein
MDDPAEASDIEGGARPPAGTRPERRWKQFFTLQDDPNYLLASYRYLRLAIPTVVVTLFVSIFLEKAHATCWNGSVSAYYYSPVHSVFVGALAVIGVALFVIRGATLCEELLLNMAGLLAPVVAFIPTSWSDHDCPSNLVTHSQMTSIDNLLSGNRFFAKFSANNLTALIIGGAVALVLVTILTIANRNSGSPTNHRLERFVPIEVSVPAVGAVLVIVAGIVWHGASQSNFNTHAHGYAAVLMFVLVGTVIASTAARASGFYRILYFLCVGAMLVGGVIVYVVGALITWQHQTLILEAIEASAFGVFWLLQTVQLWPSPLPVSVLAGSSAPDP